MKPIFVVIVFLILVALFYFSGIPSGTSTLPFKTPVPVDAPPTTGSVKERSDRRLTEDNPSPAPSANGSLKGTVKYDGEAPEVKMIEMPAEEQVKCHQKAVQDESLVVDKASKGLKWTIIRIMNANPKDDPPRATTPYALTQKGCTFMPHVVIVPPNTDLEILNPDKILHNIHTTPYDSNDPQQNPAVATDFTYKAAWLKEADLIKIECNIHPWMKGHILCHDPRYCAVTGADGTFEIKNLPSGKYKLNVWHEKFGNYLKKETIDVEILPGEPTDLGEMKFAPKK
jgi:hypothetical protein